MLITEKNQQENMEKVHFPLSFAQQRLWFLEQLNSGNSVYNVPAFFRFTGALKITALTKAIETIINRHENLKVSISSEEGKAYQVINLDAKFNIEYQDLSNISKKERNILIKEKLHSEANNPFDLSKAPLLRCVILHLSNTESILSLTFHHIITDAWSMDIFFRELAEIYNASLENRDPDLPKLPIQYIDFAVWQRKYFNSDRVKKQLDYWKEILSNIPEISSLPSDRLRPKEISYQGGVYRCHIDMEVLHPIIELTRTYNVTLFMVLITVYQTLLYRFSNQETIVVGTPVLNRHYPKVDNLIGFFVNTLAVRLDCNENINFIELLLKNRDNLLSANENQDVPFEHVVDYLKIKRNLGRHPIFQTWMVLENKLNASFELKDISVENIEIDDPISKFDLAMWIKETASGLKLRLEYSIDLYQEETIRQFAKSFEIALNAIGRNPEIPIGQIPLVSEEYKNSLLSEKNVDVKEEATLFIHEVIDKKAAEFPKNIALKQGTKELNYRDLIARVNQLAAFLKPYISADETRVMLAFPRGFDGIIASLAVLKLGAAYIPVDINWPQTRIQYVLQDSQAKLVLTHQKYVSFFPSHLAPVLALDELKEKWDSTLDYPFVSFPVQPENIAYIIYTSGSTGQPKGVLVPHRGIMNLAMTQAELFEIDDKSRLLQFASLSFDAAISEWTTTLSQGGLLCLLTDKEGKLAEDLIEVFKSEKITVVTLPPSVARVLPLEAATHLKTLVLAGEASSQALIDKWLGQVKLINAYGPTEGTVCATAHVYRAGDPACIIGKPIKNVQVYLMNNSNQVVPPHVVGEIVIGGIGVAKGYLNREKLTKERFISDFMAQDKNQYLYRTGDLGKYRADGSIEYIGRMDHQVKLRGYRIELGEVEQVLLSNPQIEEAVVLLKEVKPEQKILVGYLQFKNVGGYTEAEFYKELVHYLQARLPSYMIPEKWLLIDVWPLTVSGKIDRQQLLSMDLNAPIRKTQDLKEETTGQTTCQIEKIITDLWCKTLGLNNVDIDDDFFRIGGDSITAIQFVSKAKQAGLKLSVKQLFNTPTINELKKHVELLENINKNQIPAGTVETGDVPLSPSQNWLFEQNLKEINYFNQAVIVKCHEGLDPKLIEQSLQKIIQIHNTLGLRFIQGVDAKWKQTLEGYEKLQEYHQGICRVVSLDGYSQDSAEEKRLAIMNEVQQSLNITQGPIFQAVLFKGKEDYLFLVCHHLLIDSVSWRIILEDLEKIYKQISLNKTPSLMPEGKSYSWWIKQLITLVQESSWKKELNYWEDVLKQSQHIFIPQNPITVENNFAALEQVNLKLSLEETQQLLQKVPGAYNTQINEILLTALGFAVKEWMGTSCVSLMLEGHGREQLTEDMDLSRTVGWFTSIYPVILNLEAVEDIGTGITRVKEYLRSIPHKGVGYGMLRYLTKEGRTRLGNQKEPQLSFNYLGQWDNAENTKDLFSLSNIYPGISHHPHNARKFLIEINAHVMNGVFEVSISYSNLIHQRDELENFTVNFIGKLKNIIEHCSAEKRDHLYTPSDFPLCDLDQNNLNKIAARNFEIENIYPLSPMQSGLLATSIRSGSKDPYIRQNLFELSINVKSELVKQAWQVVSDSEPALKTGFIWQGLDKPYQFVLKHMPIEWHEYDWRDLSEEKQSHNLQALLDSDFKAILSLGKPPLFRFYLIQLGLDRYWLLWSIHHILVDGWCSSILIRKFLIAYEQLSSNKAVQFRQSMPYADYIKWILHQPLDKAENFWKNYLQGAEPTILVDKNLKYVAMSEYHHFRFELSQEKTSSLKNIALNMGVTLNNLIQVAWAVLISGYTQKNDVIFGITVSGRAIDLTGVDEMIGVFINTLPLRVKITPEKSVIDIIHEIRKTTLLIQQYGYISLGKIHQWINMNANHLLFDHLFIFENYPVEQKAVEHAGDMTIKFIPSLSMHGPTMHEQTEFPLVLGIIPQECILFSMSYDQGYFENREIIQLASHLENILDGFIEHARM